MDFIRRKASNALNNPRTKAAGEPGIGFSPPGNQHGQDIQQLSSNPCDDQQHPFDGEPQREKVAQPQRAVVGEQTSQAPIQQEPIKDRDRSVDQLSDLSNEQSDMVGRRAQGTHTPVWANVPTQTQPPAHNPVMSKSGAAVPSAHNREVVDSARSLPSTHQMPPLPAAGCFDLDAPGNAPIITGYDHDHRSVTAKIAQDVNNMHKSNKVNPITSTSAATKDQSSGTARNATAGIAGGAIGGAAAGGIMAKCMDYLRGRESNDTSKQWDELVGSSTGSLEEKQKQKELAAANNTTGGPISQQGPEVSRLQDEDWQTQDDAAKLSKLGEEGHYNADGQEVLHPPHGEQSSFNRDRSSSPSDEIASNKAVFGDDVSQQPLLGHNLTGVDATQNIDHSQDIANGKTPSTVYSYTRADYNKTPSSFYGSSIDQPSALHEAPAVSAALGGAAVGGLTGVAASTAHQRRKNKQTYDMEQNEINTPADKMEESYGTTSAVDPNAQSGRQPQPSTGPASNDNRMSLHDDVGMGPEIIDRENRENFNRPLGYDQDNFPRSSFGAVNVDDPSTMGAWGADAPSKTTPFTTDPISKESKNPFAQDQTITPPTELNRDQPARPSEFLFNEPNRNKSTAATTAAGAGIGAGIGAGLGSGTSTSNKEPQQQQFDDMHPASNGFSPDADERQHPSWDDDDQPMNAATTPNQQLDSISNNATDDISHDGAVEPRSTPRVSGKDVGIGAGVGAGSGAAAGAAATLAKDNNYQMHRDAFDNQQPADQTPVVSGQQEPITDRISSKDQQDISNQFENNQLNQQDNSQQQLSQQPTDPTNQQQPDSEKKGLGMGAGLGAGVGAGVGALGAAATSGFGKLKQPLDKLQQQKSSNQQDPTQPGQQQPDQQNGNQFGQQQPDQQDINQLDQQQPGQQNADQFGQQQPDGAQPDQQQLDQQNTDQFGQQQSDQQTGAQPDQQPGTSDKGLGAGAGLGAGLGAGMGALGAAATSGFGKLKHPFDKLQHQHPSDQQPSDQQQQQPGQQNNTETGQQPTDTKKDLGIGTGLGAGVGAGIGTLGAAASSRFGKLKQPLDKLHHSSNGPDQQQSSQQKPGQQDLNQSIQQPDQMQPDQMQPGQQQPGQQQPGQQQPGQQQPGQQQPGQMQSDQMQPDQMQPGQQQPGQMQSDQMQPDQQYADQMPSQGSQQGFSSDQNFEPSHEHGMRDNAFGQQPSVTQPGINDAQQQQPPTTGGVGDTNVADGRIKQQFANTGTNPPSDAQGASNLKNNGGITGAIGAGVGAVAGGVGAALGATRRGSKTKSAGPGQGIPQTLDGAVGGVDDSAVGNLTSRDDAASGTPRNASEIQRPTPMTTQQEQPIPASRIIQQGGVIYHDPQEKDMHSATATGPTDITNRQAATNAALVDQNGTKIPVTKQGQQQQQPVGPQQAGTTDVSQSSTGLQHTGATGVGQQPIGQQQQQPHQSMEQPNATQSNPAAMPPEARPNEPTDNAPQRRRTSFQEYVNGKIERRRASFKESMGKIFHKENWKQEGKDMKMEAQQKIESYNRMRRRSTEGAAM